MLLLSFNFYNHVLNTKSSYRFLNYSLYYDLRISLCFVIFLKILTNIFNLCISVSTNWLLFCLFCSLPVRLEAFLRCLVILDCQLIFKSKNVFKNLASNFEPPVKHDKLGIHCRLIWVGRLVGSFLFQHIWVFLLHWSVLFDQMHKTM